MRRRGAPKEGHRSSTPWKGRKGKMGAQDRDHRLRMDHISSLIGECPYCGRETDLSRRACHHCKWILNRKVDK